MMERDPTQPQRVCFGRSAEQDEFINWVADEPLDSDIGRAALLVGPAGMGKSTLLWKLADLCRAHEPESWYVQLETVNRNESPSSFLARLLRNTHRLFWSKHLPEGPNDRRILKGLLNAIPRIGELLTVLVSNETRPGWKRFVDYVRGVSDALSKTNDRLVLLIDPDQMMQEGQADEWLSIARQVPPYVRVLIAQRPNGVIAAHPEWQLSFRKFPLSGALQELDENSVFKLFEHEFSCGRLKIPATNWPVEIRDTLPTEAWKQYRGHPLAHDALIRLLLNRDIEDPIQEMAGWPPRLEALLDFLLKAISEQGIERKRAALALQVFAIPTPLGIWAKASDFAEDELSQALLDPHYAHFFTETEPDVFSPFHPLFAERLERELQRLEDTRDALAEAAWKTIEPNLGTEALARMSQSQFTLLAAPRVASRFRDGTRLLETVDKVSWIKKNLGLLDEYAADHRFVMELHGAGDESIYAAACNNLGAFHVIRGELAAAEGVYNEALRIHKKLGDSKNMACDHTGLGNVHFKRGDFKAAREAYQKSLDLSQELEDVEGIAEGQSNMGNVDFVEGRNAAAESRYNEALELFHKLKNLAGVARLYGYLGNVYRQRPDLGAAEAAYNEAVRLNEIIKNKEGMACNVGNLGNIHLIRGDLDAAETAYRQALELFLELGHAQGLANSYYNLGRVLSARKDFNAAEEMHNEALLLYQILRNSAAIAEQHACVGRIQYKRGNVEAARESWTKSRDLFQQVGMPHMVSMVQGWLDELEDHTDTAFRD